VIDVAKVVAFGVVAGVNEDIFNKAWDLKDVRDWAERPPFVVDLVALFVFGVAEVLAVILAQIRVRGDGGGGKESPACIVGDDE
jgi:hypothetical protein